MILATVVLDGSTTAVRPRAGHACWAMLASATLSALNAPIPHGGWTELFSILCMPGQQSTWDDWISGYLASLVAAGRSATTLRLRGGQLRYLAHTISGTEPDQVDTELLMEWIAEHNWTRDTLRSYCAALRGFYRWAYTTGRVSIDPAAGLPPVHAQHHLPRPVPEEVWREAVGTHPGRVGLMLRLAAEAGLRRAEIARLRFDDLMDGLTPVLAVRGKGGRDRIVPISMSLAKAIGCGDGWVFGSEDGGHLSPAWIGSLCSHALGADWTLHNLRHRFGTRAYAGSHDLRAVQELLGHANPMVTQGYVAVSDAALRAAMMSAAT